MQSLRPPTFHLGSKPGASGFTASRPWSRSGLAHNRVCCSQNPHADAASSTLVTCKRCRTRFEPGQNHREACTFHPAMYTGGEIAKAIGFVRSSDAPEHQLKAVMGRQGLLQFWDCCGAESEDAPGCEKGFHISWDTELNEKYGWTE